MRSLIVNYLSFLDHTASSIKLEIADPVCPSQKSRVLSETRKSCKSVNLRISRYPASPQEISPFLWEGQALYCCIYESFSSKIFFLFLISPFSFEHLIILSAARLRLLTSRFIRLPKSVSDIPLTSRTK